MTNQFARNPADAMQCFADAVKVIDLKLQDKTALVQWCTRQGIHETPVFFLSASMTEVISRIGDAYPLDEGETPQSSHGFLVFQRPLLTAGGESISGIWWLGVSEELRLRMTPSPKAWSWNPFRWRGSSVEEIDSDTLSDDDRCRFLKWLCAAEHLIGQKIAAVETPPIARIVRDRVIAVGGNPVCRVVVLRQRTRRVSESSPIDVQWQWQWLVRGHWRRISATKKTWITGYLKGPEGKPMKAPDPVVFAVTR